MSKQSWKSVISVQGEFQAEVMRGLLEAQGIPVELSQEGVARVYGFGIGPLAEVEILVPDNYMQAAKAVVESYQTGEFEELGDQLEDEGENL